jgi:hypothetical protein
MPDKLKRVPGTAPIEGGMLVGAPPRSRTRQLETKDGILFVRSFAGSDAKDAGANLSTTPF